MICIYAESSVSTFTLIFYTCICIPFFKTAESIFTIFTFLVNPHENARLDKSPPCDLVSRYQDLEFRNGEREAAVNDEEEMCAICLTEFDKEELVTKLERCGHVFHMECMEKWVELGQFSCPLCRSFSSPCKMWASPPP